MSVSPSELYQQRSAQFAAERDLLTRRWNTLANLRLLVFVLALAAAAIAWWQGMGWLYWLAGAFGIGFLGLAAYHTHLATLKRRASLLHDFNLAGLARLSRDWAKLPLSRPGTPDPQDPTAYDLDLLGHASLQHLLNTPQTPIGRATLQEWLLNPASPAVAKQRQVAVRELAPAIELRDTLALLGHITGENQASFERFSSWAVSPPNPLLKPLYRALILGSPALLLLSILAQALGVTWPIWIPFLGLNILLTLLLSQHSLPALAQLYDRQELLAAYARLFGLIAAAPVQAPALKQLQASLQNQGVRADIQLRRLSRIAIFAEYSRSILYPLLQFGLLWSFQAVLLAEYWRRANGQQLGPWLRALGEWEALAALATLAHDHPDWQFPQFVEQGQAKISGSQIGHPLLAPQQAVRNDVALGPPGSFLLITGSNMAGKSTLLRAVGMNIVLAQAGAPVCAAEFSLPPIQLATSMRVQDSLAHGVSYFMAELRRLRTIVDAAEQAKQQGGPTICYLLDEILHGTNSTERQIAARRVIRHLIKLDAIGSVSTHDLALADDPGLAEAAQLAHFQEQFTTISGETVMRFDYLLRPGLAVTTNALHLMKIVGLPLEDQ